MSYFQDNGRESDSPASDNPFTRPTVGRFIAALRNPVCLRKLLLTAIPLCLMIVPCQAQLHFGGNPASRPGFTEPLFDGAWPPLLETDNQTARSQTHWLASTATSWKGSLFSLSDDPLPEGKESDHGIPAGNTPSGSGNTPSATSRTLTFPAIRRPKPLNSDPSSGTSTAANLAASAPSPRSSRDPRVQTAADSRIVLRGRQQAASIGASADELPVTTEAPILLTTEEVEKRRANAAELTDLSEDDQAAIARHYQRATDNVAQRTDAEQRASDYKKDRDLAPERTAALKEQLNSPVAEIGNEIPADATVLELEQVRLQDEERVAELNSQLSAWQTRSQVRSERRPSMPMLLEETRQRLTEAEESLQTAPPEGEMPAVTAARRTELQSIVELLNATLELYRIEQQRFEAQAELYPLERDQLTRSLNQAQKRLQQSEVRLADAKREANLRQAEEARKKLQQDNDTLRDLAAGNAAIIARNTEIQAEINRQTPALIKVSEQLKQLEEEFSRLQEKEQRTGLTSTFAQQLRHQRESLGNSAAYTRLRKKIEEQFMLVQEEELNYQVSRGKLADLETEVETFMRSMGAYTSDAEEVEATTLELLTDRREYLTTVLADYDKYLQLLAELDVQYRRMEVLTDEVDNWTSERILWVRSTDLFSPSTARNAVGSLWTLLSSQDWRALAGFLAADVQDEFGWWLLCGVLILLLFSQQGRAQKWITEFGAVNARRLDAGIPLTLASTGITIIRSATWPILIFFIAWRLNYLELQLATALHKALQITALTLWIVETSRVLCRQSGVAVLFIGWKAEVARCLQKNLALYISVALPVLSLLILTSHLGDSLHESVGRIVLVIYCILLSLILRRVLHPTSPALKELLVENADSLLCRLRWCWYIPAVFAPVALAVLCLLGYQYTAEQLLIRYQLNLTLAFIFAFAYSTVMQWVLAARRNLVISQARARRAAALAAQEDATGTDEAGGTLPALDVPQLDISLINQQMLRMVRGIAGFLFLSVCWLTWSEVLPALQVVNRVELWSTVTTSSEQSITAEGQLTSQQVSRVEVIALGDLLLAAMFMAIASIAGKNLPGLLELVVLQKLPFDHGGRHAITTLCRYAIILGGIIAAFKSIGIDWGSIQWLVAALTVGLGFGLQEIFANFVSGLIILFERPVRIGDLVTIDGVEGCVTRINIRATTVTDWNRKEYIVPNRELVTGKVLNWTLTDKTNRIVVNVGVAYGSNLEEALRLLREAAEQHPMLLSDPGPIITFEEFGDNTLNLVLRCYLPNYDNRLKVITDLHLEIERRFREANVEIAFPQRDINIRSLPPDFYAARTTSAS